MMIEICNRIECTGCEACVSVCPVHCIVMKENNDGFYYPRIDNKKCIKCKKCIGICPNNVKLKKGSPGFYMGWHKNLDVLLNSSSGGAFTAIAELIIKENGVVYGACLNDNNLCVTHIGIENIEELQKLRLSKYFQGSINECYKRVENDLKDGRYVLFTGTACQIAGLISYLHKQYSNLLTVDVLCHGISSKKVIDEFVKSKIKKYKKRIKTLRFRLKPPDSNWLLGGGTKMRLDFEDGTSFVENKEDDTFFRGFNDYLFLRESCYNCKYVGTNRIADITLADYWGIDLTLIPEEQQRNGVSLIVVNSEKGREILDKLTNYMVIMPANPGKAILTNQAFVKPSTPNSKRDDFFLKLGKNDFDYLIKKYYWGFYLKNNVRKILGDRIYNALKMIIGRT